MASHDSDPRFQDADVRARVATIYLPLLSTVMDALSQLYDPALEVRPRSGVTNESDVPGITQNVAMAIAGSSVYGVPSSAPSTPSAHTRDESSLRVWIKLPCRALTLCNVLINHRLLHVRSSHMRSYL